MSEEEEKLEADPEEEKFWNRFRGEFNSAFEDWVAKESAKIDDEEEEKAKDAKEKKDDRPSPDGGGEPGQRKPSDAEQRWESGRAGVREAFGAKIYKRWGRKALYGK